MNSRPEKFVERIHGFSLVELMVGMVIALIASLAIVQVFSSYENQKRSTTAGSEAQENGLMALTMLEQDVHNSGAGLVDVNTMGCSTTFTYLDGPTDAPIPNFSLNPVSIVDGASNGADTITLRIGSNFLGSIPATITSPMPSSSSEFNVNNPGVFNNGDLSIVIQNGNCTIQNITAVQMASKKIQHNPGNSAPNNPPNNWKNTYAWPAYTTGAIAKSLGTITAKTYSIDSDTRSLHMISRNMATGVTIVPGEVLAKDIVTMQAQYGIAPVNSQVVDTWVNASGATWATPTAENARRIKAVRIAIVARSGKKESSNVTGTCTNNAGTNNGPCAWQDTSANPAPLIDLSGITDWQRYRYKVYQTIIPLRNVIWANV